MVKKGISLFKASLKVSSSGNLGKDLGPILGEQISVALGSVLGFAYSAGYLNVSSDQISGPISSAMTGVSLANALGEKGTLGAGLGFLASVLDKQGPFEGQYASESLSYLNIVAVVLPVLGGLSSRFLAKDSSATKFLKKPRIIFPVVVIFAWYQAYKKTKKKTKEEKNEINSPEKAKFVMDCTLTRLSLQSDRKLQEMAERRMLFTLITSIIGTKLNVQSMQLNQKFVNALGVLKPSIPSSIRSYI